MRRISCVYAVRVNHGGNAQLPWKGAPVDVEPAV
jgi:hypothetical protein